MILYAHRGEAVHGHATGGARLGPYPHNLFLEPGDPILMR